MSAANAPKSSVTPTTHLPSWLDDTPGSPIAPSGGSWTTVEPPRPAYPDPLGGYGYARSSYRPTAEQLARDEARRRYLRRNVYLPITVAVLVVLALFIVIVVLAFVVDTAAARSLIAGLSGLVVILIAIPLIALMSIGPLVWLGLTLNRRQQRSANPETGPMAYRSRLQTLLWQLDGYLNSAQRGATRGGAALTRPLIALHARVDYWREFAHGLWRNFRHNADNG